MDGALIQRGIVEILLSKERRRAPLRAGVASDSCDSWGDKK
jgi:hypothetical protein